jgi:LmbE family N-acetylglucosaminyl deacetylase
MKIWRALLLTLALSLQMLAQQENARTAPKPDDRLKADVLLIVAHPDDETGVSGYLAQLMEQGKRVAAVYLTHGEAGHNNMGRERVFAGRFAGDGIAACSHLFGYRKRLVSRRP